MYNIINFNKKINHFINFFKKIKVIIIYYSKFDIYSVIKFSASVESKVPRINVH